MRSTLWTLLGYAISFVGFGITLMGYLESVFSVGISQLGWIAVGNILFFGGILWSFRVQRKELDKKFEAWKGDYRITFLRRNRQFNYYQKLWSLHRLLSQGKIHAPTGGFPGGEGELAEWSERVETLLTEWQSDYLDYYRLNLNQDSSLAQKVAKLAETLEWITLSVDFKHRNS